MKKFMLVLLLSVSIFISGCSILDGLLLNGDGYVKDEINNTVEGVETGSSAVGSIFPVANTISWIASLSAVLLGGYAEMRRKQKLASDDKAEQVEVVLQSVVAAIEKVDAVPQAAELIAELKVLIKEELSDNDIYKIGKVIISQLKEL